jgi:hypothetical protein
MDSPLNRLTVLHSSELTIEREEGFYVCAYKAGDPINLRVFAVCTFKRRLDAEIALAALLKEENLARILAARERGEDMDQETRKVMTECLQW